MDHKISILFYSRIASTNRDNLVPIYLRITIDGQRIEQTTKRFVELSKWSNTRGKMKGAHAEARSFNSFLDAIKHKVHTAERELLHDGKEITYQTFKEKWFGVDVKVYKILEVFENHNRQVAQLIGKDFSPATLQRYKTSLDHTRSFIKWKYKVQDIEVTKLNYEFINDYAFWLKTTRNCNHNSTMKYLANFKKVVLLCIKNGYLQKDPFVGFKLTKREVERPFLSKDELQTMAAKEFPAARLNHVRDIFLFSCYTGLAYADVKKLKRNEIGVGVDGEQWIFTKRQKTDTASRIPLLPVAERLLDKYKDNPQCMSGSILPVLSNQKMNAYLKEIADVCGINKVLTFHIARHTFATTVTLSNGVPIETVSKMLGHTNLRTTQHYAKILDIKVGEDMKALKGKLEDRI
ncbi:site-specific integrase [Segetibacter aerophilus]|uniref:Transposase n=1 Tax=Segetibacter aerophilus TaxID=670293 RepID=A0A512BIX4_9BACT|nr:site-specific integrase [Segetibacter aerophilus]GEO11922.1 transposase [Segetibacter aerophilus]